jgi:hypothetical protein
LRLARLARLLRGGLIVDGWRFGGGLITGCEGGFAGRVKRRIERIIQRPQAYLVARLQR